MSSNRAYLDALRMLARRELSEAQVRQRLGRREHNPDLIDEAIARLREERAIDDRRVAEAIARTETSFRKRGKLRVKRKIESAGISSSVAKQAIDETFADVDADALLDAALARRLRHGKAIADDREFNRLYRYLIGQGFESDKVLTALRRRKCST
ncbi:MAG TPA: RecX family transcriptional regulator [Vicinamibacterales bacterium]|nr:RecX family transcriptional regulator [Vicinamibacterales bacterium]